MKTLLKTSALILITLLSFTSCKKEGKNPDYESTIDKRQRIQLTPVRQSNGKVTLNGSIELVEWMKDKPINIEFIKQNASIDYIIKYVGASEYTVLSKFDNVVLKEGMTGPINLSFVGKGAFNDSKFSFATEVNSSDLNVTGTGMNLVVGIRVSGANGFDSTYFTTLAR